MKIGDIDDPELFIQICSNLKLDLNDLDAFIVWRYPNEIDRFKLGSLKVYWDYIWYSMGDDAIVVVIPEKSIVILLTHYGDVKCNFNI